MRETFAIADAYRRIQIVRLIVLTSRRRRLTRKVSQLGV